MEIRTTDVELKVKTDLPAKHAKGREKKKKKNLPADNANAR